MQHPFLTFLFLFTLTLLTGCGGSSSGGGGGGSTDKTPDAFSFTAVTDADLSTVYTSNEINVSGINTAASVTLSAGVLVKNGSELNTTTTTVTGGDTLQVLLTSSSSYGASVSAVLSVESVSATFQVTTGTDNIPDPFSFTDITGVDPGAYRTSATVVVSGLGGGISAVASVSAGTVQLNGVYLDSNSFLVKNGDQIAIRLQAPSAFGASADAVLSISGVSDTFSVTTYSLPTSLALKPSAVTLVQGETQTLLIQTTPSNAYSGVTWSSSNENVATVSSAGVVTARLAGTAVITATSDLESNVSATASVTVQAGGAVTQTIQIDTTGSVVDILLSPDGGRIYAADSEGGLRVFDVNASSATYGTLVKSVVSTDWSYVEGVAMDTNGTFLYLANGPDGVAALEVNASRGIRQLDVNGSGYGSENNLSVKYAWDVVLSSDEKHLFVAASRALDIFDVSNPSSVWRVDDYAISTVASTYEARDVVLSSTNKYAFLAWGYRGVEVVDVRNVAAVEHNATITTSGLAVGVALSEDDTTLFVACGDDGVDVFDVSDLSNPTLIANHGTNDYAAGLILSKDGKRLYVADRSAGLLIWNVENVASPANIAVIDTEGSANAIALDANETTIYVGDGGNGLLIMQ